MGPFLTSVMLTHIQHKCWDWERIGHAFVVESKVKLYVFNWTTCNFNALKLSEAKFFGRIQLFPSIRLLLLPAAFAVSILCPRRSSYIKIQLRLSNEWEWNKRTRCRRCHWVRCVGLETSTGWLWPSYDRQHMDAQQTQAEWRDSAVFSNVLQINTSPGSEEDVIVWVSHAVAYLRVYNLAW